jgi:two-component system chemotaxis sensor kinase CheA
MDRDALNARLLELFVEELDDQVQAMNTDLLALEANPLDAERLKSLFRIAHTLKGAARAAGVLELERAFHSLEDLLSEVRDQHRQLDAADMQMLFSSADAFSEAGRRLRRGESLEDASLDGPPWEWPGVDASAEAAPTPAPGPSPAPAVQAPPAPSAPSAPPTRDTRTLRVAAEQLDDLLATAGEFLALGRRAEARRLEMEALADFSDQWSAEWRRSLPQVAAALALGGAAPREQEALRAMGAYLVRLGELSRALVRGGTVDAGRMSRAGDELAAHVRGLRMRPLQEMAESLPRTVRDLATSAGKEVRLEVEGAAIELDRAVLDALREAVLPLVRNAIDHGIETPAERERLGKPREATLRIAAVLRSDRVVVTLSDDGAGVDAALLRRTLEASGVRAPAGDRELAEILLGGGLSSRTHATTISGRGVGLDIVRATMGRVRGTVQLKWTAGAGTTVTLEFPPSLATLRALLVAVGPQLLGIPLVSVDRIIRIPVDTLRSLGRRPMLPDPGGPIPVVSLARVLGPPLVERPLTGVARAVIVSSQGSRAAFLVDELIAEEELVMRPLQTGKIRLALISGAAILGHGGVAPIVDAAALLASLSDAGAGAVAISEGEETAVVRRRILVADDSLTTRTLEQSVLEAGGFVVVTAFDGMEALRLLQVEQIDLVVSDVEMPRMDGFGLCEAIRASERLRKTPVILVTGRESAEDRARGMDAGADAYLLKSSFDQEQLLEAVQQLLG